MNVQEILPDGLHVHSISNGNVKLYFKAYYIAVLTLAEVPAAHADSSSQAHDPEDEPDHPQHVTGPTEPERALDQGHDQQTTGHPQQPSGHAQQQRGHPQQRLPENLKLQSVQQTAAVPQNGTDVQDMDIDKADEEDVGHQVRPVKQNDLCGPHKEKYRWRLLSFEILPGVLTEACMCNTTLQLFCMLPCATSRAHAKPLTAIKQVLISQPFCEGFDVKTDQDYRQAYPFCIQHWLKHTSSWFRIKPHTRQQGLQDAVDVLDDCLGCCAQCPSSQQSVETICHGRVTTEGPTNTV